MPRFVEVEHEQWIAAPLDLVRQQFADLDHHIRTGVHPKLRFELLEQRSDGARFAQEVTLLGIRQRDVFERRLYSDGSLEDRSVEGFNKGGSLHFAFEPGRRQGQAGTLVTIVVRLPLPPVIGPLIRPLLAGQIRREVQAAALEDKADLESGRYRGPAVWLAAAA